LIQKLPPLSRYNWPQQSGLSKIIACFYLSNKKSKAYILIFYMTTQINKTMSINQEFIGYLAAALTTGSFLPQAIKTIKTRDTSSLSLSMYTLFTLGVLCWLIYGVYLNNVAIIISNAITLLLAACILSYKIFHTFCKKP